MSILIKGMEMPKSCTSCPLHREVKGFGTYVVACCPTGHGLGKIDDERLNNSRNSGYCPLIEVPKHGRLIDERWLKDAMATTLEALIKNPKMDAQEMHIIAAFDTLREMIDDAPTVIEAEGEDG